MFRIKCLWPGLDATHLDCMAEQLTAYVQARAGKGVMLVC